MSKNGILLSVDVEAIIPEIIANHRECVKCGSDATNHAIEAGNLLLKMKKAVKHGQFTGAIEQRFDFSYETAKLYMKVAKQLPPIIKKLGKDFDVETLTLRGGCKLIALSKAPAEPKKATPLPFSSPTSPAKGSSRSAEPSQPAATNSQESAPTGNCPRGGDHDFDDEGDCKKCKEPNWGTDQPKAESTTGDQTDAKPGGKTQESSEKHGSTTGDHCKHSKASDDGKCPKCGEHIGFNLPEPGTKCPACTGTKWKATDTGVVCAKCNHPHGEPAGDVDGDRVSDARSKTIKTCEALMRAFDDLNLMLPKPGHGAAINNCKALLITAREWK